MLAKTSNGEWNWFVAKNLLLRRSAVGVEVIRAVDLDRGDRPCRHDAPADERV